MEKILLNPSSKSEAKLLIEIARRMGIPGRLISENEAETLEKKNIVKEDEAVYRLTPVQKEAVIKAQTQIASGNYYSDEEVNEEIDKWLKE